MPIEVYNMFFDEVMARKTLITQQEFSDMIAKNEDTLLEIGSNID